ncbi:MAG: hypothetical protein HQM00_02360 [Magnetococcales bacterium]|nr:hypothetical protein [Magnetococcales bacterium]
MNIDPNMILMQLKQDDPEEYKRLKKEGGVKALDEYVREKEREIRDTLQYITPVNPNAEYPNPADAVIARELAMS